MNRTKHRAAPHAAAAPVKDTSDHVSDILVARQPIYDGRFRVVGYELLYRGEFNNQDPRWDGDYATQQMLINAFCEIGIDRLAEGLPAFINVTAGFLLEGLAYQLPRDKVVLEILEDVVLDDRVVEAVRDLTNAGYRIALDDFVLRDQRHPLLPLAHIIKLEIPALREDELAAQTRALRHCTQASLLAEKVENAATFHHLRELGFDCYQGYFFCKPMLVRQRRVGASRASMLRLLNELFKPDVQIKSLVHILSCDPALGFKMLRLVNSALHGVRTQVTSLHQAVTLLGVERVRTWAGMLLLSSVDDKPHILVHTSVARARMCEMLAKASGLAAPDSGFTVGMLSTLDAIMDTPLPQLLNQLPIAADVSAALLNREGPLGRVLTSCLAYEQGEWNSAVPDGMTPSCVRDCYLESLAWAKSMFMIEG